jgi:uncharacterized protein (TIGR03083 family)
MSDQEATVAGSRSGDVVRAERINFGAMADAVHTVGDQFTDLLRGLDDDDASRPVPGLTWTVGDTAAHMLTIVRRATGDRRRADSLAGLADLNEQCLGEIETRHPHELANALTDENSTLTALLGALNTDTATSMTVKLHAGVRTDVPSGLSYVLFDFLAHGHDIAIATHRAWPIDPAHAALDLHACLPVFEPWVQHSVRTGPAQRTAVTFPGDADAIVIEVGAGTYHAQNHRRTDAAEDVSEVDPTEALLGLARRTTASSPVVQRLVSWFEPI